MKILKIINLNNLLQSLPNYSDSQYNGELIINNSQGVKWTFYYQFGQIIWATGGTHPSRRLRRYIVQQFPQIDLNKIQLPAQNVVLDYWDYIFLEYLSKEQLTEKQIDTIVKNIIAEILFDLAQQIYIAPLSYELSPERISTAPTSSISTDIFLQQMQNSWNNWSKAGLTSISPHLAPMLSKPAQLQKQVSPAIYKNFVNVINGKYTFWDLAVKLKQSVLPLTQSLLPYVRKGIIELIELPDLPLPATLLKNNSTPTPLNKPNTPLIACVDDSPQVCKIIDRIITANGLKFIGIQDPREAIPILIEKQPDLIFIDLLMPIFNGYELCYKLRKISSFSKTPMVILTSNNASDDRVHSHVYGATYFINKPVTTDKIMGIVDKYLLNTSMVKDVSKLGFYAESRSY